MVLGFFESLKLVIDLYVCYFYWSVLLYEIGLVVLLIGYYKYLVYMIVNVDLFGFIMCEQCLMSMFIFGQKGNFKKISEMLVDVDFVKVVLVLWLVVMFCYVYIMLDLEKVWVKFKSCIDLEICCDYIKEYLSIFFWFQKEQEWWVGIGVDFVVKVI